MTSAAPWECPQRIERPLMRQSWERLAYLHWPVQPDLLRRMLPKGLEPDTCDGTAWVGLVPFQMRDIAFARGPSMPYLGTFPETNVRTYVIGPDGPGVWFNSLDITRVLPVIVARLSYGLPYQWSAMRIDQEDDRITYVTLRRRPHRVLTHSLVTIRVGEPIPNPDLTPLEIFLTARWRLYSAIRGRVVSAPVEHPPWPLHRAELMTLADGLVAAGGYPPPSTEPHVLYSPGVPVLAGRPRLLAK